MAVCGSVVGAAVALSGSEGSGRCGWVGNNQHVVGGGGVARRGGGGGDGIHQGLRQKQCPSHQQKCRGGILHIDGRCYAAARRRLQ